MGWQMDRLPTAGAQGASLALPPAHPLMTEGQQVNATVDDYALGPHVRSG